MGKPIYLFKPKYETPEMLIDLNEIMMKGWTGLNGKTAEFEEVFAKEVGADYAVGTNSCTSALQLALKAIDIKPGDEIITTPMTFISTNHVILYEQAIPVFCDVNVDLAIDVDKIEKLITGKTKAIIIVHYAGLTVDKINYLYELASDYKLWIIEDAAHAMGAYYQIGKPVGCNPYERGLTCFSFHAVKNLSIGDGGMVTTNKKLLVDKMKRLRWMGIDKDTYMRTEESDNAGYNWMYSVNEVGLKCHMNDIQAVIGLHQIRNLKKENLKRKEIVDKYIQWIKWNCLCGYVGRESDNFHNSSNHLFVIHAPERDKLIKKLNDSNIFPGVHYLPNHLYSVYKDYYRELPVVEKYWKFIISLPLHTDLTDDEIGRVCEVINGGW